jgi:hypothetical protein
MFKSWARAGMVMVAVLAIGWIPALGGSAAIGSVAGSRNATLSGQAVAPNTTVFSGDQLQVREGVAVVAMGQGSRMVFGRETEASFLREANEVTVLLGRGNVSMYQPAESAGLRVKAGAVTVEPAKGYQTLGEVAMVNGAVVVTAKKGTLQVEGQGRSQAVAAGKTVTVPVNTATARAPMPDPPSSNAHITTATGLAVLGLGAGTAAAILAGLDLSRSGDARDAANAAISAANAATSAANAAGQAANAAGCALDALNPTVSPSPYVPPSGFSCP